MVGNLAKKFSPDMQTKVCEVPDEDIKWCTVTLNDVICAGKRLEASVFDIESKKAYVSLESCKYSKVNLIGIDGFVKDAHYGGRLKRNYINATDENAIGFIGSSEMLDTKPEPVKYMSSTDKKVEALKVNVGTVLISRSGTIGNLTVVNKTLSKLLISEHAIRLECGDYPGYVYSFLKTKTGQALIKSKIYGAVIQQIEPEHLASIPIPNPPKKLKEKINKLIMDSFSLRDDSNDLIEKAINMLKDELKLPSIAELNKQNNKLCDVNSYTIRLSELSGRLDGSYHMPIVNTITNHLKKNAGEVTTIGDARVSKGIILPGRFKRVYVEEGQGRVFFGGKQIFELDPSNKKYLSLVHHGDRIKEQLELHENMTLITCSGTIGKVSLVPKHWEHWTANQHIIRVVPASKDIAGYLSAFLSSEYGYNLITRYTYGSVVDEIDNRHVRGIPFPLLRNQDIQREINDLVLNANELRYKAYLLEQKAVKIMDNDVIFAK